MKLNKLIWCGIVLFLVAAPAFSQTTPKVEDLVTGGEDWQAKIRQYLPEPVLEDHPELIQLYWKAWELAAKHVQRGNAGNDFVDRYMDEAFCPNVFQWDSIFMSIYGRYGYPLFPAIEALDNFYLKQHENGFISREIREADGVDVHPEDSPQAINPPLFSWAEWEFYQMNGDKARLTRVFPYLEHYYQWLKAHRRRANGLYWTNGLGSGMDNSPRDADGWVDLSSQQAANAYYLEQIATELEYHGQARFYHQEYLDLRRIIDNLCWSNQGMYMDVLADGRLSVKKTIAGFWPLFAGITDSVKASKMVENLKNPNEFYRTCPFATLAASEPEYNPNGGYWLGSVWPPTNYMVLDGLSRYNYSDFARTAALKYLEDMSQVLQDTGTIWENYAPDKVSQGNQAAKDFLGWSGLGPIANLIEQVLGFEVDTPSRTLHWQIGLTAEHGIRNLHMGSNVVSVVCEPRKRVNSQCVLRCSALEPFTLDINWQGRRYKRRIMQGDTTVTVAPNVFDRVFRR